MRRNAKFWQVCDIHQTATGNWIPARARIYREAAALNHEGPFGLDSAFLANKKIRNVRMNFTTHRRVPWPAEHPQPSFHLLHLSRRFAKFGSALRLAIPLPIREPPDSFVRTIQDVTIMREGNEMIEGILPPIPTPFSGDDVAYDKLMENVSRWNHTGLSGYVVFGSNGESAYLTTDEKLRLAEVVRESAAPEQLVIAGTGCESTRQTIRLTNEAATRGADAALVLTPRVS